MQYSSLNLPSNISSLLRLRERMKAQKKKLLRLRVKGMKTGKRESFALTQKRTWESDRQQEVSSIHFRHPLTQ